MSEKNNNNHGGKRTGSGRKEKSQAEKVKPIIIHLYKEEIESLNVIKTGLRDSISWCYLFFFKHSSNS